MYTTITATTIDDGIIKIICQIFLLFTCDLLALLLLLFAIQYSPLLLSYLSFYLKNKPDATD